MLEYQTRSIEQWPGKLASHRQRSPFRAGWGDTMALLDRELKHLKAKAVVLLMALRPSDIRLDGRPRADVRPMHPGVILSFESLRGPMQFPCDKFDSWSDNVRAIALALEALRKVDRYGVTRNAEQYRGWQQLPDKRANGHMTRAEALTILRSHVPNMRAETAADFEVYFRQAEFKTHPDRGGNAEDFKRVQEARKVLIG